MSPIMDGATALTSTMVPARRFGARPNTGVDVSAEVQNAFDGCPLGATLVFEPGTYLCNAALTESRGLNVMAYGAVFDFGTTNVGTYAVRWGNTNATHVNKTFKGLTIQRTAADATTTTRLYEGFRWQALVSCHVADVRAINFAAGHRIIGETSQVDGNSYNNYHNLMSWYCKYGIHIKPDSASDWCNENNFFGGRMGEAFTDPINATHIRIEVNNGSIVNGNHFYGMSLEGDVGRKIYCEGQHNSWTNCRYEGYTSNPDGYEIEFNSGSSGGTGTYNRLVWGFYLNVMTVLEAGTAANNQVIHASGQNWADSYIYGRGIFLGGQGNPGNSLFRGDNGTGGPSGHSGPISALNQSAGAGDCISVLDVNGTYKRLSLASAGPTLGGRGAFVWRDDAGAIRNEMVSSASSPYRITSLNGIEGGTDLTSILLQVVQSLNGTVNLQVTAGDGTGGTDVDDVLYYAARRGQGGRHFFSGGTAADSSDVPAVIIKNIGGADGAHQLAIAGSLGVPFIKFRQGSQTYTSTAIGNIEFYHTDGTTFRNSIFLINSAMGPTYPMCVRRGMWINHEQGNSDTRISSDTDTDCFYLDASALSGAGAVGIGTATPDSKLHVNGNAHVSDAEIDGALNHDGTTVGFYGATPAAQSTGWTITNKTEDKVLDCDATSIDELADVLGTLIDQLKTHGLLGG